MRRMFSENQIEELIKNQAKDITTLVDKDGHERFIEGEITPVEIAGITPTYAKWSLSGTHLMMVYAFNIANGTSLTAGDAINKLSLPAWIKDKIIPITSIYVIPYTSFIAMGGEQQQISVRLEKQIDGSINMSAYSFTANSDKSIRIQFDLLIDNE